MVVVLVRFAYQSLLGEAQDPFAERPILVS
jgi:hypothetical protein